MSLLVSGLLPRWEASLQPAVAAISRMSISPVLKTVSCLTWALSTRQVSARTTKQSLLGLETGGAKSTAGWNSMALLLLVDALGMLVLVV